MFNKENPEFNVNNQEYKTKQKRTENTCVLYSPLNEVCIVLVLKEGQTIATYNYTWNSWPSISVLCQFYTSHARGNEQRAQQNVILYRVIILCASHSR